MQTARLHTAILSSPTHTHTLINSRLMSRLKTLMLVNLQINCKNQIQYQPQHVISLKSAATDTYHCTAKKHPQDTERKTSAENDNIFSVDMNATFKHKNHKTDLLSTSTRKPFMILTSTVFCMIHPCDGRTDGR